MVLNGSRILRDSRALQRIAFIVQEFALGTPAQQLLDRFLIGYPREAEFHRQKNGRIVVHLASGGANPELDRRLKDFGLNQEDELARVVANAIVVVWRGSGGLPDETLPVTSAA